MAPGSTARCSRHSPASPSHSTAARRIRIHARCGERLLERRGRSRLAVADEGEAVLDAMSIDHLARDHLEVALFPPVPAAHTQAEKAFSSLANISFSTDEVLDPMPRKVPATPATLCARSRKSDLSCRLAASLSLGEIARM